MSQLRVPDLVDLLRETLEQSEQSHELPSDDPILTELRRSILLTIAELNIARSGKAAASVLKSGSIHPALEAMPELVTTLEKITTVVCWICGTPVPLEDCKTNDHGHVVHESATPQS